MGAAWPEFENLGAGEARGGLTVTRCTQPELAPRGRQGCRRTARPGCEDVRHDARTELAWRTRRPDDITGEVTVNTGGFRPQVSLVVGDVSKHQEEPGE